MFYGIARCHKSSARFSTRMGFIRDSHYTKNILYMIYKIMHIVNIRYESRTPFILILLTYTRRLLLKLCAHIVSRPQGGRILRGRTFINLPLDIHDRRNYYTRGPCTRFSSVHLTRFRINYFLWVSNRIISVFGC